MANWLLILDEMESRGAEIYDTLTHLHTQLVYTQDLGVKINSLTIGDTIFMYIGGDVLTKKNLNGLYDVAMLTDITGTQYTFKSINAKWREYVSTGQSLLSIEHNKTPDILFVSLSSEKAEYYKQEIDMHINFINPVTKDIVNIVDTAIKDTINQNHIIDPFDKWLMNDDSNINKKNPRKIILTGILSNVLGEINRKVAQDKRIVEKGYEINNGVKVLRGFVPFKDLEPLHKKDDDYQRKMKDIHRDSLIKFIESDNNFIPEITYAFRSNQDDKFLKQISIEKSGASQKHEGKIQNLNIYDLILNKNDKLYCIDGNHRFEALKELYKNDKELLIPFCIIFVPDTGNKDFIFNEPSYFFNLNGRSEPLLYGDTFRYINDNLKDQVNIERSLSTYKFFDMLKQLDNLQEYQINDIEYIEIEKEIEVEKKIKNSKKKKEKHKYTEIEERKTPKDKLKDTRLGELLFQVYKEFEDELIQDDRVVDDFVGIVEDICSDREYIESLYIYKYCNDILPSLVLYLYYKNNKRSTHIKDILKKISEWLSIKQLTSEHFHAIENLYLQYEQYKSCKDIYIFMAMPFYPEDKVDAMNEFKNKELLPELTKKFPNCRIEFPEIMREKSEAREIWDDIRAKIFRSDIVICDITDTNPNVIYEMGLAYGKGKKLIVIKKQDNESVKFDMYQLYRIQYEYIEKKEFKDELTEKIINIIHKKLDHLNL